MLIFEKKVHDLLHRLVETPMILFSRLFESAGSKSEVIVTFLAILELIRLKEITVRQLNPFSEIQIMRHPQHMRTQIEG